jgi:hypothetical protein
MVAVQVVLLTSIYSISTNFNFNETNHHMTSEDCISCTVELEGELSDGPLFYVCS